MYDIIRYWKTCYNTDGCEMICPGVGALANVKTGGIAFANSSTPEGAYWNLYLPDSYDTGSNLTFDTYWLADLTTGDLDVDIKVEYWTPATNNVDDASSWATAVSVDGTSVASTAWQPFKVSHTMSNANMDSFAADGIGRVAITRDGTNDTAAGTAYLICWRIHQ